VSRSGRAATRALSLILLAITAMALIGCGGGGGNTAATTPPAAAPATTTRTPTETEEGSEVKLRLTVGGTVLRATMLDSETTRDFISLLPLTLTLSDYAQTEKVSDLPRRLSTAGAPDGVDPDVGDIAYYAPWGNLAIYYRDFGYSSGLVKPGSIESGVDELGRMSGDFTITIELAESALLDPLSVAPRKAKRELSLVLQSVARPSSPCHEPDAGTQASGRPPGRRQRRQRKMEPLWSPAVATGRNRWQMEPPRKPLKQAKTVAVGW
jgi:hypothetical protein